MTNPTSAAGTPAADPYLRWETMGGWSAQPDQRTLERERLESRAQWNGRDLAAVALLPKLDPRARAVDLADTRAARRQRAGRPQRPGRLAQPRRPRPSGPSPPRQGEAQRHAPDFGGDHGPDRRPGGGRPRRRTRLEHRHDAGEHARRAAGARPRHAARRPRRSTRLGVSASISGACSPDRSGSTTIWRTTCRGGCSPTPASSTPATCAAGGSARPPGCRSPASGSGRSARSSGRSACSSYRRSDRATGGS